MVLIVCCKTIRVPTIQLVLNYSQVEQNNGIVYNNIRYKNIQLYLVYLIS